MRRPRAGPARAAVGGDARPAAHPAVSNQPLVELILSHLSERRDRAAAREVCRCWREAADSGGSQFWTRLQVRPLDGVVGASDKRALLALLRARGGLVHHLTLAARSDAGAAFVPAVVVACPGLGSLALQFGMISAVRQRALMRAVASAGRGLTSLALAPVGRELLWYTRALLAPLLRLSGLQSLALSGWLPAFPAGAFSRLTSLTALTLRHSGARHSSYATFDAQALLDGPRLQMLDLAGLRIQPLAQADRALEILGGLRTMAIFRCIAPTVGFASLSQLTNLIALVLPGEVAVADGDAPRLLLAAQVRALHTLQMVGFRDEELPELPTGALPYLTRLRLSSALRVPALPPSWCGLSSLHSLEFEGCEALRELPPQITALTALQRLSFSHQRLESLPAAISGLSSLTRLAVSACGLRRLVGPGPYLAGLRELVLFANALRSVPAELEMASQLTRLDLALNIDLLDNLSDQDTVVLGRLTCLVSLDLRSLPGVPVRHCAEAAGERSRRASARSERAWAGMRQRLARLRRALPGTEVETDAYE